MARNRLSADLARLRRMNLQDLKEAVAIDVLGWYKSDSGKSWRHIDATGRGYWSPTPLRFSDHDGLVFFIGDLIDLGYTVEMTMRAGYASVVLRHRGGALAVVEHPNVGRALCEAALMQARGLCA